MSQFLYVVRNGEGDYYTGSKWSRCRSEWSNDICNARLYDSVRLARQQATRMLGHDAPVTWVNVLKVTSCGDDTK